MVADIGAGSGYFSFLLAPLVPQGKVIAVDVQQEMLDFVEVRDFLPIQHSLVFQRPVE